MIGKFVYKYLWASDIDKSASSKAVKNRANDGGRFIYADSDADSSRLNHREPEEYQKDCLLWFGLMLAERDTQRDIGCCVVQDYTYHEVHKSWQTLAHAENYAFKDGVDA